MQTTDEEVEAFLRQFALAAPRALPPTASRSLIRDAVAATMLIGAVLVGSVMLWKSPAVEDGLQPAPPVFNQIKDPSSAPNEPPAISPGLQQGRIRVGGAVKAPRKIVDARPVYPEHAKEAGIQSIVRLDIVIGEDGSVVDATVLQSIPELDQAAIDAVLQWRYEPTLLNGQPVEVAMVVTINFSLSH